MKLAVIILDVLNMDVRQLFITLPLFNRPVGIPSGILQRRHLPGIDLQIIGAVAAVDQFCQMLKIHLLTVDPLYRNIELPRLFLNHYPHPLSGHLQ